MAYKLTATDVELVALWKKDEGLIHTQIVKKFNEEKGLKGDECVTYKDVRKALKGVPSKHREDLNNEIAEKKAEFARFFNDL